MRIRHYQKLLSFVVLALTGYALAEERSTIAEVETAYLYRFLQFTQWPEQRFTSAESPLELCVVGSTPLAATLPKLTQFMIGRHPIQLKFPTVKMPLQTCHAVFVGRLDDDEIGTLASLQHQATLIISEENENQLVGAMIHFVVVNNRVRFTVNLSAAKAVNLYVNSDLLDHAYAVEH